MPTAFFDTELCRLRESLTQMGGAVERMLDTALSALRRGDAALADQAIALDKEINDYDNRITSKTILLIATNQPVAGDLRFLASSLKMAGELERIGDLSANLARRAKGLARANPEAALPEDVNELSFMARSMLSGALDAFANRGLEQARRVLEMDDAVDDLNREVRRRMVEAVAEDGPLIHWALEIINTAAHLERLADHATNLAEEVIYIYSGRNVRHCGPASVAIPAAEALTEPSHSDREDLED